MLITLDPKNKDNPMRKYRETVINAPNIVPISLLDAFTFTTATPVLTFLSMAAIDPTMKIAAGISAGVCAKNSIDALIQSALVIRAQQKIKDMIITPETHPFEYIQSISVVNSQRLLDRTAKKEWHEWGNVLNAELDGETTRVVFADQDISEQFYLKLRRKHLMVLNNKMKRQGFNGFQHYHPFDGTSNYCINICDRTNESNWVYFLTFNTNRGPELIGYNTFNVFLPTNDSKTEFEIATQEDIMRYLA